MKPPTEDIEGFDDNGDDKTITLSTDEKCPNLLIQEDGGISLYDYFKLVFLIISSGSLSKIESFFFSLKS